MKLTINRTKWQRGTGSGTGKLYRSGRAKHFHNAKGFLFKAAGISLETMQGKRKCKSGLFKDQNFALLDEMNDVSFAERKDKVFSDPEKFGWAGNTNTKRELGKAREKKIAEILQYNHGVRVNFVK